MRILTLFFLSGIFSFVHAKEFFVNYKQLTYTIKYTENFVSYKASNIDLSLVKKKCNEHIIKKAIKTLESSIEGNTFLDKAKENTYKIQVDQITKYDSLSSPQGQFFANFNDYFKTLKIEEMLSCKK